jgi:hypothetical protein
MDISEVDVGPTYVIQQRILTRTPRIAITESEFEALRVARRVLSEALSLEDIYGILVANYGDFERALVCSSVEEMVGFDYGYDYFFATRQELNRRLVNLLTATRLYLDQLERHVRRLVPDGEGDDAWLSIKKCVSAAYDEHFEYRFMEELRNRTQHRGVPVDAVSLGGGRDKDGHLAFKADLFSSKEQIALDRKFKKSVVAEMPDKVDLKLAVRTYVSALSVVHGEVRKRITASVESARSLMASTIDSYPPVEGTKPVGLQALRLHGEHVADSFPLMLDWDDTRVKLGDEEPSSSRTRKALRNQSRGRDEVAPIL